MSFESPSQEDARIDIAVLLAAIVRRLPLILLVTLGLLAAGFVLLMFQPRLYESAASILVEPRDSIYLRASGEQAPSFSGNAAGVVSSQIELLKSRDTLLNVIDQLDLRSVQEFNDNGSAASPLNMITQLIGRRAATPNGIDETVLTNLYERLKVTQERDSAIISVVVQSSDPQLAANIANAVANAHVARRADLSISDTAEASGWLLDEINRLRVSVQQAESAVADFRVENDLFVGQNNTSLLDQQLSTVAAQITAAQERKNTALTRAALIRGLIEKGQPIEGVADVRNSLSIQQLSQEKARLQGELAQRSATLLSSHPNIRALNAQIAELDSQIRQEGRRVATALEAEAQIESDLETSLRTELDRAKASASTATRDTVTLDGLQREAKAQRELLEAYLLRYNEASSRVDTNSALPDVRVVSVAAPSVTPASPKTSLIMVAIGIVSIAVQIGMVALGEVMSGRALAPVQHAPSAQREDDLEIQSFHAAPGEEKSAMVQDEAVRGYVDEPAYAPPLQVADALPDMAIDNIEPEFEHVPEPAMVPDSTSAFVRSLLAEGPVARLGEDIAAPTPGAEPEAIAPPQARVMDAPPRRSVRLLRYSDLVSDLVLGRTHLLLLADHGENQPSRLMAEELVADALAKGLSVALVDAGSGRRTENAGITDLSTGAVSFGDVVQKSADNSFAEVTWGQGDAISRRTNRPLVLTEALGDIYEVVVVLTGRADHKSMLGSFAELGGRVILVTRDEGDADTAEPIRARLEEAGLARVEIAALAEPVAA